MRKKPLKFLIPSKAQWKRATPFTRLSYLVGWSALILFIAKLFLFVCPSTNKKVIVENNLKEKKQTIENTTVIIEKKTFKLKGLYNNKLKEKLEQEIDIDRISNNFIEITYSGEILRFSESSETYIYNGGYLIIKTNTNCHLDFFKLKLPALRPNSKHLIISEIKSNINTLINLNLNYIFKQIITCL